MYTAYFVSAIRDSRDVEPKIIDVRRLDRGNDQWASHLDRLADCYLVMYVQTITATPMTHLTEVHEMQVINILCAYVKLRRKGVRHINLTPSSIVVSSDGTILVTDVSRALIVSHPNSKDTRREWYPQEVSDVAQGLAETIEDEMVAMDTTEKIKLRNYLRSDKIRDLFLVLDG
jgi:RIO-like serine/threonine protein kinase